MSEPARPLSAAEAAARLGVKRETLYAYVSRGMLSRSRAPDGRASLYDPEEVEGLARRVRRGGRVGALEILLGSELTLIEPHAVHYRGRDARELCRSTDFERVAEWLWDVPEQPGAWSIDAETREVVGLLTGVLPASATPTERLQALVAGVAPLDPFRIHLRREQVAAAGRRLISALAEGLPAARPQPRRRGRLAARLWARLAPARAPAALEGVLNAALVLLADHGLATSTLAARVAASVRADPYAVVAAGLAAVGGRYHGAASGPVHQLLVDAGSPRQAAAAVADVLRDGRMLFGLGHPLYPDGDPRATELLDQLRGAVPGSARMQTVEAVLDVLERHTPDRPNVDFVLAALTFVAGMPKAGGETIFALGRIAGWLAHAIEEYAEPVLRFRTRAHYTGPRP